MGLPYIQLDKAFGRPVLSFFLGGGGIFSSAEGGNLSIYMYVSTKLHQLKIHPLVQQPWSRRFSIMFHRITTEEYSIGVHILATMVVS